MNKSESRRIRESIITAASGGILGISFGYVGIIALMAFMAFLGFVVAPRVDWLEI